MRRLKLFVVMVLLLEPLSGCSSLFHNLQPHRLRRLNRGPAPALDPEFTAVEAQRPQTVVANSGQAVTVRAQQ
uniref:Uncharacterized protein n=1 Tax=Schlesneria paludicola TaxID=360056 RepID=A0A7C2K0J8_9PLAN